jgi:hypothetical protein
MSIEQITVSDFEDIFGEPASDFLREKIQNLEFSYQYLSEQERDTLFLVITKELKNPNIKKSGPHRISDWQNGWGANRKEFVETNQYESLIPKYFGKFPYVRWRQNFIKPVNKDFEYNMAQVLQYWIFEKYFANVKNVYEFGCGTGHNLFRAQEVNPLARVHGLDWAESSQKAINDINRIYKQNFGCHNFDFFNVDENYTLGQKSGVYTFAALEQVGGSHEPFLKYLISQEPEICVHIEPIAEMLSPESNFVDFLSTEYFSKRNYLDGFIKTLKNLESQNKIEIIKQQRSYIGSMFVDGYSIVVWRPKNA